MAQPENKNYPKSHSQERVEDGSELKCLVPETMTVTTAQHCLPQDRSFGEFAQARFLDKVEPMSNQPNLGPGCREQTVARDGVGLPWFKLYSRQGKNQLVSGLCLCL